MQPIHQKAAQERAILAAQLKKRAYRGAEINWLSKNFDSMNLKPPYLKNGVLIFHKDLQARIVDLKEKKKHPTICRVYHELKWKISPGSKKKFDKRMDALALKLIPIPPAVEKDVSLSSESKPVAKPMDKKPPTLHDKVAEWEKAADKGDVSAIRELEKLSSEGNLDAQVYMGFFFLRPNSRDAAAAYLHLARAAQQGHIEAVYELGRLYFSGELNLRDFKEGVRCFKWAADRGHAHAQFDLALMLDEGKIVVLNEDLATHYFKLAAAQGVEGAKSALQMRAIKVD